ncbi:MAG: M15 family metallopeptidase [Sarcina sp.]
MKLMESKKTKIGISLAAITLVLGGFVIFSTGGGKIVSNNENSASIKDNEEIKDEITNEMNSDNDISSEDAKIVSAVMENENDVAILCNKLVSLGENYKPQDLVVPNVNLAYAKTLQQSHLREEAARALEELFKAAKEAQLEDLYLVSGFRSYEYQNEIFTNSLNNRGREHTEKYMAKPGHSEHQTGLTADISTKSQGLTLEESFEKTKEGQWLAQNAYKFGFILRYPEDRVETTGYAYEPWHFRYVGKEISEYMFKNNLVLEDVYETVETFSNSVG